MDAGITRARIAATTLVEVDPGTLHERAVRCTRAAVGHLTGLPAAPDGVTATPWRWNISGVEVRDGVLHGDICGSGTADVRLGDGTEVHVFLTVDLVAVDGHVHAAGTAVRGGSRVDVPSEVADWVDEVALAAAAALEGHTGDVLAALAAVAAGCLMRDLDAVMDRLAQLADDASAVHAANLRVAGTDHAEVFARLHADRFDGTPAELDATARSLHPQPSS